ncbi:acyl-CoA dehydrogenase family protein [Endozoicomonas numazuensis]|uniref:Acyl-CoA dehydrogenase n=1 Tax=Endozoicomonas numazuensis TaxID=1137799 RepID=A0A081NIZ8_9GAMM|nr:acyl-CoA dehydrogenase family protein [Endozoicomonas numazuensis]KEQ18421.1 acyl-CoA dehydrogenase [Endozoicomonas numazuensis]
MKFTEEHSEVRRTMAQIIEKEINPYVEQWEEEGIFPAHDLFKKLGNLGLLGISKPVEYGGLGLDYSFEALVAEELGAIHCGSIPMAVGVQTNMATPALARFGSHELRDEFLTPAIAGDQVASIAVSEPGAGSDVAAIKTEARKDGDDYVINGSKMWITNSTQADFLCVLANTSDDAKHINKSLIIVPTNTPGVEVSPRLNKLGMRSSDTAQIFFDDVRVPQRYRIGAEGQGFTMQMQQFQEERLFCVGSMLKTLDLCVSETADYCYERKAFGKPLLDNQYLHYRLAELQTETEIVRAAFYQAVEQYVGGEDVTKLASMLKLKTGRLAREVTDGCLQFWGGMGYMWDNKVSRFYRDSRLMSIGGGADEVMLGIICKYLGLLPGQRKSGQKRG